MVPDAVHLSPPRGARIPDLGHGFEYLRRGFVATDGGGVLRAWGDPDRPFVLRIDPAGSRWRITPYGVDGPAARRAVRALFALDHPLDEFYRATRREPVLRGTDRRFPGLRIPRDGSLYESLVHAVIGQQLSVRAAASLERRLVAHAGSTLVAGGIDVPHLPGPTRLSGLAPEELRRIGLSRAKSRALLAIARAARAGELPSGAWAARAPAAAAIARLDALPGVGRWTAENALLRGAGRRDMFLAGDLGLRGALAAYGAVPRDAPEPDARRWADRWYPGWGSYASLYLWRRCFEDGAGGPVIPAPPAPAAGRPPARGAPSLPALPGSRRRGSRAPAARRS